MIVDIRTYTFKPGRLAQYVKLYEAEGKAIQWRHLGRPQGWWVCHDLGPLNQLVHVWAYQSLEDRVRRRAAMQADPEWLAFIKKGAEMLVSQESKIGHAPAFMEHD